ALAAVDLDHGVVSPGVDLDQVHLDVGFHKLVEEGDDLPGPALGAGQGMATGKAPDHVPGEDLLADGVQVAAVEAVVHLSHDGDVGMLGHGCPPRGLDGVPCRTGGGCPRVTTGPTLPAG